LSVEQTRADEAFARASGCFECHNMNEQGIGPSFRAIAAEYRSNVASRAMLIEGVRSGSKGKWPAVSKGVPMPPYSPRISNEDIERLVDWIRGL
jgi:cytochrome c551/c552